ncbi:MAG: hypothetical protein ACRDS9_23420 [Pseudonocardiaceae bacterium]
MEHQLTPASRGEDADFPRPLTDSHSALTECLDSDLHRRSGLGVRSGESDPGRMLSAVLLLVMAIVVLGLAWWLV